jgi:hypothetical protein
MEIYDCVLANDDVIGEVIKKVRELGNSGIFGLTYEFKLLLLLLCYEYLYFLLVGLYII